jgi:hypothetical protein
MWEEVFEVGSVETAWEGSYVGQGGREIYPDAYFKELKCGGL